MYYNEKIIDGVLMFRTSPDGDWKPLSPQSMTTQITNQSERINVLEQALREALPYVEGAYECAFPDESENIYVKEKIQNLLNK